MTYHFSMTEFDALKFQLTNSKDQIFVSKFVSGTVINRHLRLKGGSPETANHSETVGDEDFQYFHKLPNLNFSSLPSSHPGTLSTGERALLHAMRKLTVAERKKTLGKVADEDPYLAQKLKNAGSGMNDLDWKRFDSELQERMASKYAAMAAQVSLSAPTRILRTFMEPTPLSTASYNLYLFLQLRRNSDRIRDA